NGRARRRPTAWRRLAAPRARNRHGDRSPAGRGHRPRSAMAGAGPAGPCRPVDSLARQHPAVRPGSRPLARRVARARRNQRGDAVSQPQYHLKLLLNRMGVARGEVEPWHRAGLGKGPPERSHAISNLFLPPEASKAWVDLPADKRRLSGVRLLETANPEEEAQ